MTTMDENARRRFLERAVDGRISCADCMAIAEEMDITMNEIALTLTEMRIKIIKCQLGCFP